MLPLPSGSNRHERSFAFDLAEFSQVGEVRRFAATLCAELEFDEVRQGKVAIVINELGNNLVKYARSGQLILRAVSRGGDRGLEILSVDKGPGIPNISLSMEDGFTTGSTPGTGLGAVRRQSDVFDIFSEPGRGTLVVAILMRNPGERMPDDEWFEVGAVCLPIHGESVCGDGWSVRREGRELHVLVADGLGHGPLAHKAATEAIEVFFESKLPQDQLMKQIHGRLKSTRGAAVFLASSATGSDVRFCGVGNIRSILFSPSSTKTLISQNGTAGLQIRTVTPMSLPWGAEAHLVLHSDGLTSRWDNASYPGIHRKHPSLLAAALYRDYVRGTDDATVVVIGKRV